MPAATLTELAINRRSRCVSDVDADRRLVEDEQLYVRRKPFASNTFC